jgi:4-amino-4-deoxy-L-arabinose transferase-like glycosyltransferase
MAQAGGVAVVLSTLALLLATEPSMAIVWDEGFTIGREVRVRMWLRALRDPESFASAWVPPHPFRELVQPDGRRAPLRGEIDTRDKLFCQHIVEWFWPFGREEPHGHPPFYAMVGLVGDALAPRSWTPLARARLGPMIAFSLAAGSLFAFAARRWGLGPAIAASGAFVLQPRLFAHAHYAHYDALLTSLWVSSIIAFTRAVEPPQGTASRRIRWGWTVLFGVLAGWAADTKFTGWFLPLPFLAWTALFGDRRSLLTLAVGSIVAAVALYAFNPPWWFAPMDGIDAFLRSNLSRAHTTRIYAQFLGQVFLTPKDSLPWYNTVVWTVFVTPVGFLLLALAGVTKAVRGWRVDPIGLLPVGHWAFLLILRALPHTPGHDAERQFLAAFGCLALVVGMGAVWLQERFGWAAPWLSGAALAEGAVSIALMMPVLLSYYSPLVGGLPGATRLGMEATYYWDALDDHAIDWINRHTKHGEKVQFPTYPTTWAYLQQVGKLRAESLPWMPGTWKWFVFQNRAGSFSPLERELAARATDKNILVQKWGIPLIYVFAIDEVERTRATLTDEAR